MEDELLQVLRDFVTTSNSGKYKSEKELISKFPELTDYDTNILKDFVATSNSGKYKTEEELLSKFPEFNSPVKKKENSQPDTDSTSQNQNLVSEKETEVGLSGTPKNEVEEETPRIKLKTNNTERQEVVSETTNRKFDKKVDFTEKDKEINSTFFKGLQQEKDVLLKEYRQATSTSEDEKAEEIKQIEDKTNNVGFLNTIKDGFNRGYNMIAPKSMEVDLDFLSQKKEIAKEQLKNQGKEDITDIEVLELAKKLELDDRLKDLKVSKTNDYLENLTWEDKEKLELNSINQKTFLSQKNKERLKNIQIFDGELDGITKEMLEILEVKKDRELTEEEINTYNQLQQEGQETLKIRGSLANEHQDDLEELGTVEEEFDLFQKYYGWSDKGIKLGDAVLDLGIGMAQFGAMLGEMGSFGLMDNEKTQTKIAELRQNKNNRIDAVTQRKVESAKSPNDYIDYTADVLVSQTPNLLMAYLSGGSTMLATMGTSGAGNKFSDLTNSNNSGETDYKGWQKYSVSVISGGAEMIEGNTLRMLGGAKRIVTSALKKDVTRKLLKEKIIEKVTKLPKELLKNYKGELKEESLTFGIQTLADAVILDVESGNVLEEYKSVLTDTGIMTLALTAVPRVGAKLIKPFTGKSDVKKLDTYNKELTQIEELLNSEGLSDETLRQALNIKKGLQEKIDTTFSSVIESTANLSQVKIDKVIEIENENSKFRNQAEAISKDKKINKEQKAILLKPIEDAYNKNEDLRQKIIDGKTNDIDFITQEQQLKAKEKAIKELQAEQEPNTDFEITDEQVSERAESNLQETKNISETNIVTPDKVKEKVEEIKKRNQITDADAYKQAVSELDNKEGDIALPKQIQERAEEIKNNKSSINEGEVYAQAIKEIENEIREKNPQTNIEGPKDLDTNKTSSLITTQKINNKVVEIKKRSNITDAQAYKQAVDEISSENKGVINPNKIKERADKIKKDSSLENKSEADIYKQAVEELAPKSKANQIKETNETVVSEEVDSVIPNPNQIKNDETQAQGDITTNADVSTRTDSDATQTEDSTVQPTVEPTASESEVEIETSEQDFTWLQELVEKDAKKDKPKKVTLGSKTPLDQRKIKDPEMLRAIKSEVFDAYSLVQQFFISGGRVLSTDIADLYRGSSAEIRARIGYARKNGTPISKIAHDLWEEHGESTNLDSQEFSNAVEDVIQEHLSTKSMAVDINIRNSENINDEIIDTPNGPMTQGQLDDLIAYSQEQEALVNNYLLYLTELELIKLEQEYKDYEKYETKRLNQKSAKQSKSKPRVSETPSRESRKSPEIQEVEKQIVEAEERLALAKTTLKNKAKNLDNSINKDNEDLFGERESQQGNQLFDERVDINAREEATTKERQAVKDAETNLKNLKDKKTQLEESGEVTSEIEFDKKAGDSLRNAADLLRNTKFVKSINDLNKLSSDPLGVFKVAWDGAISVTAKALELNATVADAIEMGLKEIRKSDWYKKLNKKSQKIVDDRFINDVKSILPPKTPKNDSKKDDFERKTESLKEKVKKEVPKEQEPEVNNVLESDTKTREQAFTTKALNSGNLNQKTKDELYKLGFDYSVESQFQAEQDGEIAINKFGLKTAYDLANSGEIRGGARIWIQSKMFDELLQQINDAENSGNTEIGDLLSQELASIIKKFADEKTLTGQETAMLNRVYSKSSIQFNLDFAKEKWSKQFGKEMSPTMVSKFKNFDKNIKKLEEDNKKLEKENGNLKEQEAFRTLKELSDKNNKKTIRKPKLTLKGDEIKEFFELRKKFTRLNDVTGMLALLADPDYRRYLGLILKNAKYDAENFKNDVIFNLGEKARSIVPQLLKAAEEHLNYKPKEKTESKIAEVIVDQENNITIPGKILYDLVADGIDNIEKLTDAVTEKLIEKYPELKKKDSNVLHREVRDAITKYGKQAAETKDQVKRELSRLKTDGQQISALEDLDKGERPKRSGRKSREKTPEQRNRIKKIRELLKTLPFDDSADTEKFYKTALEALKERASKRIKDLQDAIDKNERLVNEKRKTPLDEDAKKLITERDAKQKEYDGVFGKVPKSHETLVSEILERKEETLKGLVEQKQFALINKSELPKDGKTIIEDQRIDDINNQIDQARKELSDVLEEVGVAESKRLERLKKYNTKKTEEYKTKLANKDFTKRKNKSTVYDKELINLKKKLLDEKTKWEVEFEKEEKKQRNVAQKILHGAFEVLNISKGLMASIDLSAPLRQGAVLGASNPREWARAAKEMHKFAAKSSYYESFMANLESADDYIFMVENGLSITDTSGDILRSEERFAGRLLGKKVLVGGVNINLVGAGLNMSERSYGGFLNHMRVSVYRKGVAILEQQGHTQSKDPKVFKNLAKMINHSTGRGPMLQDRGVAKFLNLIFFSPRMISGMFALMRDLGRSDSSPYVRKQAAKSLVAFAAYQVLMKNLIALTYGALLGDEDDEIEQDYDGRSTAFGKLRVNDTYYDTTAGWGVMMRTAVRFITGEKRSDSMSKVKNINDPYGENVFSELASYFTNKLSPTAAFFYKYKANIHPTDFMKDRDEATTMNYVESLLIPLTVNQVISGVMDDDKKQKIVFDLVLANYGVGVQTYGKSKKSKLMILAKDTKSELSSLKTDITKTSLNAKPFNQDDFNKILEDFKNKHEENYIQLIDVFEETNKKLKLSPKDLETGFKDIGRFDFQDAKDVINKKIPYMDLVTVISIANRAKVLKFNAKASKSEDTQLQIDQDVIKAKAFNVFARKYNEELYLKRNKN